MEPFTWGPVGLWVWVDELTQQGTCGLIRVDTWSVWPRCRKMSVGGREWKQSYEETLQSHSPEGMGVAWIRRKCWGWWEGSRFRKQFKGGTNGPCWWPEYAVGLKVFESNNVKGWGLTGDVKIRVIFQDGKDWKRNRCDREWLLNIV